MDRSQTNRRIWALGSVVFLALAAWQMGTTFARAPAFNGALQSELPEGTRIPNDTGAIFDRTGYEYWAGRLWFDRYRFAAYEARTATGDELRLIREKRERASAQSRENALDSLRRGPSDPMSWMLLARAELALGNYDAAVSAYLTCQRLSPHNSVLAAERVLFLMTLMSRQAGWDYALADIDREILRTDLVAMKSRMGRLLRIYRETREIRALLGEAPDGV